MIKTCKEQNNAIETVISKDFKGIKADDIAHFLFLQPASLNLRINKDSIKMINNVKYISINGLNDIVDYYLSGKGKAKSRRKQSQKLKDWLYSVFIPDSIKEVNMIEAKKKNKEKIDSIHYVAEDMDVNNYLDFMWGTK